MDGLASGVGVQLKIVFHVHHCYVLVHSPLKFIGDLWCPMLTMYALSPGPNTPLKQKEAKKSDDHGEVRRKCEEVSTYLYRCTKS